MAHIRTFSFMMSLLGMPHLSHAPLVGAPKGCKQYECVWACLYRNDLVGTGRDISVLFGINGDKWFHLVGLHFQQSRHFSYCRSPFLESLDWMFVNWWVWLVSAKDG